jgi:hypothetical protein
MTTLIACLLCGLYVEGSVMALREQPPPPPPFTHWLYERTVTKNPYGTIAVGLEHELRPGLRLFGELRHESALGTREDDGEDSVRLGVRWYPFGGAR